MKKLYLLDLSNEARDHQIEIGAASIEDFVEAKAEYDSFTAKLDCKERVTEMLRESYVFFTKKRKDLERQNAEARLNGVPYKERTALGAKIATVEALLTKIRHTGASWAKNGHFEPLAHIDVDTINRMGMDWYLKFVYIPCLG